MNGTCSAVNITADAENITLGGVDVHTFICSIVTWHTYYSLADILLGRSGLNWLELAGRTLWVDRCQCFG